MSNTDNEPVTDILKLIKDLACQSLENHFWMLRQYGELRQRIARGEWDETWVNEQYVQYASEQGPRYRKQLADLGASYQRALTDLSREWSERFYARLEAGDGGRAAAGPVSSADGPLTLEIRGILGTEAIGPLALLNRHQVPIPITFDLGEVVGDQGRLPYHVVRIDPEAPVLAPGEQREVQVRAALIEGLYEAGRSYRMALSINGRERTDVMLTIRVDHPAPDAGSASTPPPEAAVASPAISSTGTAEAGSEADGAQATE